MSPDGSLRPGNEQTLMHLYTLLADSINHSSIKVYLSAVHSLLIENGFPNLLVNCLQLQCLLRGIKCVQGSNASRCLLITIELLKVIQR